MNRDEEIDRLQRQEPDWAGGRAEPPRVVQSLREPGADTDLEDQEGDLVGEMDLLIDDTVAAEEAAIHVVEEPPGLNYDADPGYVEDEG